MDTTKEKKTNTNPDPILAVLSINPSMLKRYTKREMGCYYDSTVMDMKKIETKRYWLAAILYETISAGAEYEMQEKVLNVYFKSKAAKSKKSQMIETKFCGMYWDDEGRDDLRIAEYKQLYGYDKLKIRNYDTKICIDLVNDEGDVGKTTELNLEERLMTGNE